MGYWSTHPMGGDSPMDASSFIKDYMIEKEGVKDDDGCYWYEEIDSKHRKNLFEKYKYELIDNIDDILTIHQSYTDNKTGDTRTWIDDYTDCKFALVFEFLDYDIRVNDEYLPKLQNLLGDGGASSRGYTSDDKETPLNVINIVNKHFDLLFSEKHTVDEAIDNLTRNEAECLICKSLIETIFEHVDDEKGLINRK